MNSYEMGKEGGSASMLFMCLFLNGVDTAQESVYEGDASGNVLIWRSYVILVKDSSPRTH